jgi:hypothetical protein
MKHGVLWLGSYETSFAGFLAGRDDPRRKDGTRSSLSQDASRLDNLAFGYMQMANAGRGRKEEYCAVGVRQHPSAWIRCARPVDVDMERHAGGIKAFSPAIREIDDACARNLLSDLAKHNPDQRAALLELSAGMGWGTNQRSDSSPTWRGRAFPQSRPRPNGSGLVRQPSLRS